MEEKIVQKLAENKENGKYNLCFFGSIHKTYNLDVLIKAVIKRKDSDVFVTFIGPGLDKQELMEMTEGHESRFAFFEPIPKKQIPSLFQYVDGVFVGAKSQKIFRFGISMNKLFDSMMGGKPIIYMVDAPNNYIEEFNCGITVNGEDEKGIGNDWNYGVEKAEGRFVTVTHQDDLYNRHYVEELKKAYERWPDMSVFMTDGVLIKDGKLTRGGAVEAVKKVLRLPWRFRGLCHLSAVKMSGLIFGNPVMCPSCSYGKDRISLPLFSDQYDFVLDWDCMRKLALKGGRFVCVEKPLLYYRVHDGAATKVCIKNHKRERRW